MNDKREALVEYYMYNMLDNLDMIRDALEAYLGDTEQLIIEDLYKDLIAD